MMKLLYNRKTIQMVYFAIVFGIFFILYTKIVPIMVCDPDDWTYISYIREAIPKWGAWNPTKIFPETFMGAVGYFAAFVIYPVIGDYLYSMTIAYALVVTIFICVYVYWLNKFIQKRLQLSIYNMIFVSIIFLVMHFLILKTKEQYNSFMLTASNLNCFMNYLVPALLNGILVFRLFENDFSFKREHCSGIQQGCMLLILYLTVFSNMVVNIMFLSLVICTFFYEIYGYMYRNHKKSRKLLNEWLPYIIIFFLEFICLFFEANGGRADDLEFEFRTALIETISDIKEIIGMINKPILVLTLLVMLIAFLKFALEKDKKDVDRAYIKCFIFGMGCFVLCATYTICLFIRVGLHKLTRCENIFVIFFYYNIVFIISLAYIIKKIKWGDRLLPVVAYILFFEVMIGDGNIYKGSIPYYNYDTDKCEEINQNIIAQFIEADKLGMTEFDVILPEHGLGDYDFTGARIAKTLYKHGIVNTWMTVHVSKNKYLD